MGEKENDIKGLINEAIDASIKFEALMDKTDFDSWLEDDSIAKLESIGQVVAPFENFEEKVKELRKICKEMKQKGTNELPKSGDKSSLEKYLIYNLFEAKIKRLDARISIDSKMETDNYKEALDVLLASLSYLKISDKDEVSDINNKLWRILFYNDLSICYSGLRNSSMSQGYAEETRKIIENDSRYKDFNKRLRSTESNGWRDIKKHDFVSSKLYDLYTIAIFNQAEAKRLSYLYTEAERNFKEIMNYAKNRDLINFNYFSAIVNLSDLYIGQGRGRESLEILKKVIDELGEGDIRYWKAYLEKVNVLIDQSEYDAAKKLLLNKFIINEKENSFTLRKEHKVTYSGFKGLMCFAICNIERVRNTLMMTGIDKERELKLAENVITGNISVIIERKHKDLKKTAYKHLSSIYDILGNEPFAKKYLIKFLSGDEKEDLNEFAKYNKVEDWINECDDLSILEMIIKIISKNRTEPLRKILDIIREKIKKECIKRDEPFWAENLTRMIEAICEEKNIKMRLFSERPKIFNKGLNKDNIRKRLDINEKEFDSVLFKRSEPPKNHLVDIIMLRRWNSFSPGLFRKYTGSLGGGYFIRINKKLLQETSDEDKTENIVIDPGYNFLQNFCNMGFSISDIDTIVITHSHLDHSAELLPIMDLVFQINKRYDKYQKGQRPKKKVNLCLSRGAYKKFFSYTMDPDWQKQLKDVIILENLPGLKWELFKGLNILAIQTRHMDLGGANAIGLKIEIDRKEDRSICLGFTSDTPWCKDISDNFKNCDFLCVHLGSIKYQEIGYTDERYIEGSKREIPKNRKHKELKETYAKANHLLFFGTKEIIKSCSKENDDNLIIVGEFGEELKYKLREDLCEKFSGGEAGKCLPCDIGLYIGIEEDGSKKVRCHFCEEFVSPKEIRTFSYGKEDAIHYICETCDKTLSELQKQDFVEHRLTRH